MDNIVKLPFSLIVDLAPLTVARSSPPRAPNNPTRTGIEFILPREQQTVIERDFRAFAFTNGAAVRSPSKRWPMAGTEHAVAEYQS